MWLLIIWLILLIIWGIFGIIGVVGNFLLSWYDEDGITIKSLIANFPIFLVGSIAVFIEIFYLYQFHGDEFLIKKSEKEEI